MLLDRIKKDQLEARKNRLEIRSNLLTTLYAEAAKKGKDAGNRESTDEEVLQTIKSFLKSISIFKEKDNGSMMAKLQEEENILTEYLPEMINTERLEFIIEEQISKGKKDMGSLMKYLKETYPGQYDAKDASRIIKVRVG